MVARIPLQTNGMRVAVARSRCARMIIRELSFMPHMERACTPMPRNWLAEGGLEPPGADLGFHPWRRSGPGKSPRNQRDGQISTILALGLPVSDFWDTSGFRTLDQMRMAVAEVGGPGEETADGTVRGVRARVRLRRGWDKTTRGADAQRTSAPRECGAHRIRRAGYMPAARNWSRSTLDDACRFCGRFSPSDGRASSWRCFTTVRLATMAARAINPTPSVRISASRSGEILARHTVRPAPYISEIRAERSFVLCHCRGRPVRRSRTHCLCSPSDPTTREPSVS